MQDKYRKLSESKKDISNTSSISRSHSHPNMKQKTTVHMTSVSKTRNQHIDEKNMYPNKKSKYGSVSVRKATNFDDVKESSKERGSNLSSSSVNKGNYNNNSVEKVLREVHSVRNEQNIQSNKIQRQAPIVLVPKPRLQNTDKYQEVVRKKADREALKGYECEDCKKFYEVMEQQVD